MIKFPAFFWALVWVFLLAIGFCQTPPAMAVIQELKEAPQQMLYQSRQTLKDQHNHTWQGIAFKRILPDGNSTFYLRLVGFPETATIERNRPLTVTNSLGESFSARDVSSNIFTDETKPEPNVGQYNLEPIFPNLITELPIRLMIPIKNNDPIILGVSPVMLQEWKEIYLTN